MKCANCGSENWLDVDQYRFKDKDKKGNKIGMSICSECSFISYPSKWKTKEEIYKHYKTDYRSAPTANNLFTGQRKNHFHAAFLKDLFEKWQAEGKKSPVVFDVGTAFGMSLGLIKSFFPKADVGGSELTETMKRVAFHEFGLTLSDEIDENKKYDLIMSYKVLEHQLDPIEELKKYSKLLKEDGLLYISVPTWFNTLSNFGLDGFDLEYYYDPNHINVWTKECFENILLRAGFEIVKEDHIIYGNTYLCKASDKHKNLEIYKHDKEEMFKKLELAKKAFLLFSDYKYKEALEVWPDYPQAWIAYIETQRAKLTEIGFDAFHTTYLKEMMKACPTSSECVISATDFCMRAKQFDQAIEYANLAIKLKPNNPISLVHLVNIFKELYVHSNNENEKIDYLKKSKQFAHHLMDVSIQNRDQAISEVYFLNSLIPIEKEV
jgi:SAM-dependent methyltransferase